MRDWRNSIDWRFHSNSGLQLGGLVSSRFAKHFVGRRRKPLLRNAFPDADQNVDYVDGRGLPVRAGDRSSTRLLDGLTLARDLVLEHCARVGAPFNSQASKRALDLVVAGSALVLLSPVLAMVASIILFVDGGPVIYRQPRIGKDGKAFKCFKFRTMINDADEHLDRYLALSPAAAREWETCRKLTNDPRVTRVGAILRASSIDELPQIVNVLRGEMSLVGPRPVTPDELDRYARRAGAYTKLRPGITGLWQVSGRSATTYRRRVAMDNYYAAHRSLLLDFKIIAMTFVALLRFDQTS
ncbi:MAG: sugar transferase [Pseudomonadota bacterium]